MSIVSVNQVLRFVPYAWRDDRNQPIAGAPTYLIRPPSIMTKARWRRDLGAAGAGAAPPDRAEMMAVLRRGIREIVAEHQQDSLLALIEEYDGLFARVQEMRAQDSGTADERLEAGEALKALSGRMDFLEGEMRRKYPPYAQVISDRTFWFETAPVLAAQHFLCGWENVEAGGEPLAFAQVNGLVPEALLDQLPAEHVYDVGWRAMGLTAATQADEKNSGGASGSGASPTRSPRTRTARGSSTAKPSRKTPGQASRAGSPT